MASKSAMKFRSLTYVTIVLASTISVLNGMATQTIAANAKSVISYDQGTNAIGGYNNPNAAVGPSPTDTGTWDGTISYVTPFNNPYSPTDVVSIGLGGHLTLQLDNYALPTDNRPEIGVFSYQMFYQNGWPNGGTNNPVQLFRNNQGALVDVSEDGISWISLNNSNPIAFDIPANAFKDVAATNPSDYGLPFTGSLSDFDNKITLQDTLDVYNGSAGGAWLDISTAGLNKVGYVRFSVPDNASYSFELEGISIATDAVGTVVPEPATIILIGLGSLLICKRRTQKVSDV